MDEKIKKKGTQMVNKVALIATYKTLYRKEFEGLLAATWKLQTQGLTEEEVDSVIGLLEAIRNTGKLVLSKSKGIPM